ncbi:MAG TPA: ferritin [Phycisphaerae bacterium]|nr:ferritin [Phycisphaerae bacterium]HSA28411.1 ferritin [Phycisphaerae bacterium]
MITDKMAKALSEQVNFELSSAYLYLAMGAQFEADNLPGFAHWMKAQYQEETSHGMKLFNYLADRGGRVTLNTIAKPAPEFGTPLEVFKTVLAHERKVTAAIHALYELAMAEKDYATQSHLQWFINEQVEEEKNAEDIIRQLEALGDKRHLLMMLDHRLGERKVG